MLDEEPIVIHSADRQFTVGALCFLRDEQGQVCAHEVLLVSFDGDNRRIYHVLVRGKVHRYREGDRRLLTGFEADFPQHHLVDWSDYDPAYSEFLAWEQRCFSQSHTTKARVCRVPVNE
jgi:hypothetical protein